MGIAETLSRPHQTWTMVTKKSFRQFNSSKYSLVNEGAMCKTQYLTVLNIYPVMISKLQGKFVY